MIVAPRTPNSRRVPQVIFEHGGRSYDLEDIIKSKVKNLYRCGVGDLDELALDAFCRAARKWHKKSDDERRQTVTDALAGDAPYVLAKVAPKALEHFAVQKLQSGYLPPDPIGEGQIFGKLMLYVFRCFQNRSKIDWSYIADDAKAHGHRQIHDIIERQMLVGDLEAGGVLVPSVMVADLVPYLEDAAVVRRLGAHVIEMPEGTLDLGRMSNTVITSWIGETGIANASSPTTDEINLVARKLRTTVVISNDLVRQSPVGLAGLVGSSARARAVAKEDAAFIRGRGTQAEPKGIYWWTADSQKFNQTAATLEGVIDDCIRAISMVAQNNHPLSKGGWMMHARTKFGYMALTDADNNLTPLTQMMADDELFGFPVGVTNGVPKDLGVTSNESEVYFGDFATAIVGQTLDMAVEESKEATVTGEDGSPIRTFDRDLRAIRLLHGVDFGLMYSDSFSVIEGVTAGA